MINIPTSIMRFLQEGAALVISISGGKDSQAMLCELAEARKEYHWTGFFGAVHAHLGRMEWKESLSECYRQCNELFIPLTVVTRQKGDLLQAMQDRMKKKAGDGKPFWPSQTVRYCTSDHKRNQINPYLRKWDVVISAEGIRAQESNERAKKLVAENRVDISSEYYVVKKDDQVIPMNPDQLLEIFLRHKKLKGRIALTWRPLLDYKLPDVWRAIGTSLDDLQRRRVLYKYGNPQALEGWPAHPAYVYGNERVSCVLCIMASKNDLQVGAKHNPDLFRAMVEMENESGFSFQHRQWLRDITVPTVGTESLQPGLFDECI